MGLALVVGTAAVLGACSGGGDKGASSSADTTKAPDTTVAAPAAALAAAPAAAPAGGGTAMPATGKTIEVKLIGDEKGYRFEPANFTVKVGDAVKFTNVSGGPHNVAFNTVPDASKGQLDANMPATTSAGSGPKLGALSGPLLVNPNDTYTVSFAGVTAGKYDYNCTPHLALGMKGEITVQ
jgi:plastocyanin